MGRLRAAGVITAAVMVAGLSVPGQVQAREKEEEAKGGEDPAVATVNGQPVTKADWSTIMKADQWYGPQLKQKAPFSEQMAGKPFEDFFFTEEVVKIRVMAQKYSGELPQMKAAIDEIHKKVTAGEDFAELAKATSQDAGTAPKGGDAGQKEFHEMVFPFNRVMMKLKEGEISDPIMTIFGYHVLKVDRVMPAIPAEGKGKRVSVRHILIKFPSPNARAESEQLAKEAKVEVLDKGLCKKLPTYCAPAS